MSLPSEIVERIQAFAESCREFEVQRQEELTAATHRENYDGQLDETLKRLRGQVDRQESVLQELRARRPLDLPRPDLSPAARLAQTRRAIEAYRSLSSKEPELPAPGSPLNALLAFRETSRLIQELKASVSAAARDLASNRERLNTEEANLRDARLITTEVRNRLEDLRKQQRQEAGKTKSPSQLAKDLIRKERKHENELEMKSAELKDALKHFVEEHLAAMLAAEDLGGPVVGDQVDVPDSTLDAGYTTRGKEKKSNVVKANGKGLKQQRIDQLVRQRADGDEGSDSIVLNKREAAAMEFHAVLEKLLNATSTSSYVELGKDSAVSRFLIKAKVAQFHPRDSRKIRLINVSRGISD
ncbi:predicted protein [Uncinocarpus reesii 1704]|uniref:Centromere protein Cenp-K n=1 Tax=Uncinocarpus reesii (strain UAMH 1704) TaxID=336963 RepID=C4JFJ7_UNCRE|nr:uncharacterized protein UREG_01011 [Uncinocarpus reesii 1704]EEP76162.1 predicted protein [Uncinocarpus reesii 1704]